MQFQSLFFFLRPRIRQELLIDKKMFRRVSAAPTAQSMQMTSRRWSSHGGAHSDGPHPMWVEGYKLFLHAAVVLGPITTLYWLKGESDAMAKARHAQGHHH
jgi:hypothetical protein